MPPRSKLYIDFEGVKRGYYVYLHKNPATGQAFYVGKGHGKRGWETNGRNSQWKEKAASHGWEVEIVKDDLSEIEAYELEAELVEKLGDCAATGGTLTNWLPGGETPASIEIGIQLDDGKWFAAYCDARTFREFPREEQERLVREFCGQLHAITPRLESLQREADDQQNTTLSDIAGDLECIVGSVCDAATDFQRRRISWKEFALSLEDTADDLESEAADAGKQPPDIRTLLKEVFDVTAKFYAAIDSGNRKVAEEIARRNTGEQ